MSMLSAEDDDGEVNEFEVGQGDKYDENQNFEAKLRKDAVVIGNFELALA